jgi:hypothetical protein
VQRDVLERSSMAVMMDNRRLDGRDRGRGTTNLFFSKVFGMTAQVVRAGALCQGWGLLLGRRALTDRTASMFATHLGNRLRDNLVPWADPDDDRRG